MRSMRSMLFNDMVVQVLLHGVEVRGGIISLSAWNEIEKIQNLFLHRQLGVKFSTSYLVILLGTRAPPIEVLAMCIAYKYITNVKNLPNHKLAKQAQNIGCNVQKTKSKILSSSKVLDIVKWFKRWGAKDLLECYEVCDH